MKTTKHPLCNPATFTLLTATAVALYAVSAKAQVAVYDGFDYAPGTQLLGTTVNGAGGVGFSSTWSATSAALATNTSPGLVYSTLPTTGGSVTIGNPVGTTATTASSQRIITSTFGALGAANSVNPGTLWLSFLYQNTVSSIGTLTGYREAKIGLFSGATVNANGSANVNGTERLDIGTPNTYTAGASDSLSLFAGSTFVGSGSATPRGTDPVNTVFVLVKFTLDNTTANDTATAWFNPVLANGEAGLGTGISFTTADLSSINAIRLQAGNQNGSASNAVFIADELRVGNTFSDAIAPVIVPEPATLALGALGGLALAFCAKRKLNGTK